MRSVSRGRYFGLTFALIGVLVFAQVSWWAWNFLDQATQNARLSISNLSLESSLKGAALSRESLAMVQSQLARRRTMFVSEACFFALASIWALYLLYRALRRERRAQDLQRSFIEMVSHESKTPLTALKLRLEDLREGLSGQPPLLEEVQGSLQEVSRLSSALDKVLSLNRSERETLSLQPVALSPLVEAVLKRTEPFLKSYGAAVHFEKDPDLHAVLGDRAALETSIQCLIENSVLHNTRAEDRQVWIGIHAKSPFCAVEIRDNGPGIEPEDRHAIFSKFVRGSRSGQVPGTGLGLYIAKRIVDAHRGILRLRESSPSGSIFEMTIPAVSV